MLLNLNLKQDQYVNVVLCTEVIVVIVHELVMYEQEYKEYIFSYTSMQNSTHTVFRKDKKYNTRRSTSTYK